MKFDSIIFDLDGTFWDTCGSCAIAWNTVLKRNKIDFREITYDDIRAVCGESHEDCIRMTFKGLSEEQIQILIDETMTEDNVAVNKHGGHIYDGVKEGLKLLSQKYPLYIVSNCQDGYIENFMEFSGFGNLFKDYESWGRTKEKKSKNLESVKTRNSLSNPIYIGDTNGDYNAAKEASMPFVHVTYGFGKVQDVPAFDNFTDLTRFLLN